MTAEEHNDLEGVVTLLVDPDRFGRDIIMQMLRSLGIPAPAHVSNGEAAKTYLECHHVDLCLCEATLPDMDGADLIHWIRHSSTDAMRGIPVIVLTGDTQLATIAKARDSGANIVVKKPVSQRTLKEHVHWVMNADRPMVDADDYVGPDRRFREGKPPDEGERRHEVADPNAA